MGPVVQDEVELLLDDGAGGRLLELHPLQDVLVVGQAVLAGQAQETAHGGVRDVRRGQVLVRGVLERVHRVAARDNF